MLTKENIPEKGVVCVRNLDSPGNDESTLLKSHQHRINAMAFSKDITFLAVSSVTNGVIRIFDLVSGKLSKEVRRSFLATDINSLSFDTGSGDWLLVSDRLGDSEVFYVHKKGREELEMNIVHNRKSYLSFLGKFFPYFGSEWSFAKYRNSDEVEGVSRFLDDGTFIVASKNGNVCNLTFDKIFGGECLEVKSRRNFLIINDQ